MLVKGRVVHARRQQHDVGIGSSIGRQFAQGLEQQAAVVLDFAYAAASVKAPETCLHGLAIGDHVGHAGRYAQIVLKHQETIVGTHDVAAADGDPDAFGNAYATHLDAVLGTAAHDGGGDDAVSDDARIPVDVREEAVQGEDALAEARLDQLPVRRGEDAGNAVDGNDAFDLLIVAVQGERDAFVRERGGDVLLNA